MYKLSVKNPAGNTLELTHNRNYAVVGVQGLSPVAANINTSTAGINDGVTYNSARLNYRNIIITLRIIDDVENARIALYDYFQTKQACTLYYKNGARDVFITGFVETFECDFFELGETAQISIICPYPYFKNVTETISSGATITGAFEFPTEFNNVIFSTLQTDTTTPVYNAGDVSAGMDIAITITGAVTNPVIYNATTGEFFALDRDFVSGDEIRINTRNGEKSVKLIRFGVEINLINSLRARSSWLKLARGNNTFTFSASSGVNNMQIIFTHTDLYAGV